MSTQNKLSDLNNHLFEEIERLNDESLKGDDLTEEINRAKAITGVACSIIANANVCLNAAKFLDDSGYTISKDNEALKLLGVKDDQKI